MSARTVRRAFVLGAGLGTRLRPLTERLPKPLIPVFNKPLASFALDHLLATGIEEFIINTHHLPGAWRRVFNSDGSEAHYRGRRIMFRHEPVLLETGGGLKNIEDLAADEPLLIYNGDILTSLPLDRLLAAHAAGGCEVTLALRSSGGPLQVALDPNTGLVRDIRGELFPSNSFPRFLFTGVYVISPEFFARLPSGDIFSIIRIFLQMLSGGLPIRGVVLDEGLWMDLGDREAYLDAHHVLAARHFDPGFPLCEPLQPVHPSAHIAPGVILSPASSVGPNAEVGAQAEVLDSVLWECAKIASRARVERCIVCNHDTITGNHKAIDFA